MTLSRPFADRGIYKTPGMLSVEEREYLYLAAKERFSGKGSIVDAGALFGASAFSLAAGLADNPNADPSSRPLHSYDWFLHDRHSALLLDRSLGLQQSEGEDFFDVYLRHVAPVGRWLTVHRGDFANARRPTQPIEILFVDVCKSQLLNSHLIKEFFPALVEGRSLLVHQDYHHPHLPHIHITMEYLADSFSVENQCIGAGSIVYRCLRRPTKSGIEKCVAYSFASNEKLDLMQRAIERLSPENRAYIALANVILILTVSGRAAAETELANVMNVYSSRRLHLWDPYVEQVIARIAERKLA
jgi:hypothetical protein